MFYIDEGNGQVQTIKLNSRRIKELNDWEWHTFKMQRFGKEVKIKQLENGRLDIECNN